MFLIGCSSGEQKAVTTESLNDSTTFPIKVVEHKSIPRERHYNLDSIRLVRLKVIDSNFFKQWFDKKPVSNFPNVYLKFDAYSRYYFFDHKNLDSLFLFSLLHNDEIGYNNLYHFTFDKNTKRFVQIDLIAQTGGDGGQSNMDILHYNKLGDELIITSIFTEEDDHTITFDSTITKVKFNSSTVYTILHSYTRTDSLNKE